MDDPHRTPASDRAAESSAHAPPAEADPSPEEPVAEVHVQGGEVQITLPLPAVASEDLRYFVGSNLVLVWSANDADDLHTLVHLPVDVEQGSSVARFTNGVFDLTVLAASGAAPSKEQDGTR